MTFVVTVVDLNRPDLRQISYTLQKENIINHFSKKQCFTVQSESETHLSESYYKFRVDFAESQVFMTFFEEKTDQVSKNWAALVKKVFEPNKRKSKFQVVREIIFY